MCRYGVHPSSGFAATPRAAGVRRVWGSRLSIIGDFCGIRRWAPILLRLADHVSTS